MGEADVLACADGIRGHDAVAFPTQPSRGLLCTDVRPAARRDADRRPTISTRRSLEYFEARREPGGVSGRPQEVSVAVSPVAANAGLGTGLTSLMGKGTDWRPSTISVNAKPAEPRTPALAVGGRTASVAASRCQGGTLGRRRRGCERGPRNARGIRLPRSGRRGGSANNVGRPRRPRGPTGGGTPSVSRGPSRIERSALPRRQRARSWSGLRPGRSSPGSTQRSLVHRTGQVKPPRR
jgi:hypothetical protein